MTAAASTRAREQRWAWCTEERINALCVLLENGLPVVTACARLGIPRQSLKDARKDDAEIAKRVSDALAVYEQEELLAIRGADDWRARSWLLEKRFPKRYGKRERLDHGGVPNKPIETRSEIKLTDVETLVRIARSKPEDDK